MSFFNSLLCISIKIVGLYFLAGGIYMVTILPAPTWFVLLDVILGYIPMALLGWKISK